MKIKAVSAFILSIILVACGTDDVDGGIDEATEAAVTTANQQLQQYPNCTAVGGGNMGSNNGYAGWGQLTGSGASIAYCILPNGQVSQQPTQFYHRSVPVESRAMVELNVQFDNNKAVIKTQNYHDIDRLAHFMHVYPQTTVVIEGHTDSSASNIYNLNLSDRRAHAVKRALVKRGISEKRIEAVGFGERRPIANNSTAHGRAQNRRVEAVIEVLIRRQ